MEKEGQQHKVKVVDAMDWVIVKRTTKLKTQQQKQREEGWTSRKTIQIFVKPGGSKKFPTKSATS